MRGSIPSELGNLSNLRHLDLSGNDLIGLIPPVLGNLGNLQYLDLKFNGLRGSIPSMLGNLGNLQYLDLRENDLSGPIPPALGNLGNLQHLDLSWNKLSGLIPSTLGNLDSLQYLHILYRNDLSGCIPSALLNIVNNDLNSGLSVCGDDDESTPVGSELEPEIITGEITPEIVGLYGTLVTTFTDIFFAVLVGGTSVEGEGGGSVEIAGNDWMFQDYSPDGELIANGTINVGMDQTPIPLTGTIVLSGSHEAELMLNMDLSLGTDSSLSAEGTITINGAEFDVAELSVAAEASG